MLKKTKKSIRRLGAVVMALAMAMSVMAINAFAVDAGLPTLKKAYTKAGTATVAPAEALSFDITDKSATDLNVDSPYYNGAAELPDITLTKTAVSGEFVLGGVENIQGIGNFTYMMTEKDGGTAGVTYATDAVKVNIIKSYKVDAQGNSDINTVVTVAAVGIPNGDSKTDTITNTFTAGDLTIDKVVKGAFGDKNKKFAVTVTLTAPEGETVRNDITLSDGQTIAAGWTGTKTVTVTVTDATSVTLSNIPAGVTYKVEETAASSSGYTVTYGQQEGSIADAAVTATVTNTKDATTPTGVIMNIAPYVLMVALAGGIAFFFLRRKHAE